MAHAHATDSTPEPELAGRRAFLLASLAAGTSLVPGLGHAAQAGPDQEANVRLVSDFCAAVSRLDLAGLRRYFATDIVYRMTETTPPIAGVDDVLAAYTKLNATSIEFKVLETMAAGPIVINRRVDRFVSPRPFQWEGIGVFFIKDGLIKEWSDFTIRMERG